MTTATTVSESPANSSLKRLQFVQGAAEYAYGYVVAADKLYRRARESVPASVAPTLQKVEETVSSYAVPLVNRAEDAAAKGLYFVDDKVDKLVLTADSLVNTSKATVANTGSNLAKLHEKNVKLGQEARDWYLSQVQSITDWAKETLNPIKAGRAALDTLNASLERIKQVNDPDSAAKLIADAWGSFASVPVVAKALDTADPLKKAALNTFYSAHDNLVGLSLYKKVVDTGASTLVWASHTTPYKLGAQYVYPMVKPIADPAVDKLSSSKLVQETIGYWKPVAAA